MLENGYLLAAIIGCCIVVCGVLVRFMARSAAQLAVEQRAQAWESAAAGFKEQIDQLKEQVSHLTGQHQANAAKIATLEQQAAARERVIARITRQRDALLSRVRKLSARVLDLEQQLAQLSRPPEQPQP